MAFAQQMNKKDERGLMKKGVLSSSPEGGKEGGITSVLRTLFHLSGWENGGGNNERQIVSKGVVL